MRCGNDTLFLTAAIGLPNFPIKTDVLREVFRALELGADAVMTASSLDVVTMLTKEDIPVMGHLGLVPRKSTWVGGGLRTVGKTADEAFELYQRFKRLEDAGAFAVEALVPEAGDLSRLGADHRRRGADVIYLFMEDICGEREGTPRHARPMAISRDCIDR